MVHPDRAAAGQAITACRAEIMRLKRIFSLYRPLLLQLLAHAATKGAVSNLTAGLAQLLADRGIRVNAVTPGPIWTPLITSTMPAEKASSFGQQVPPARAGQPAELAPAYVLLASDDGSYITGAVVPVTGGCPML